MLHALSDHIEEVAALILFGIGFSNLLLNRHMMKKIIGFSMMDSAIYLFLAAKGYIEGRKAPIVVNGVTSLTLALTVRLYRRYHTLDIDEITTLARKEES